MTMQEHGIVAFNEVTQDWTVGVEVLRIGSSFVRQTKVIDVGRSVLRGLMDSTGETANMAIANDGEVVFVSQVETHESIRAFFPPGTRGPMHASGMGKALLASMHRRDVERVLHVKGLPSFAPKTITSSKALFDDLEQIRNRGWSVDDEERNIGMRCLAASIFNGFGEAVAGISISGPTSRVSNDKLAEFGPLVKRAALEITNAIGGKSPEHG